MRNTTTLEEPLCCTIDCGRADTQSQRRVVLFVGGLLSVLERAHASQIDVRESETETDGRRQRDRET